jgi:aspartyl-tRNA(Asn)/glutamyl-tRNA(Gln) amidotransferase subunit A
MRSLNSIEENKKINAIVTWNPNAEREAREALSTGLEIFPIAVKDNIMTRGIRTTLGSKVFYDFIPSIDAEVIRRIKRSGGIVVGKTNTHELASGITTTSSVFGPTRNPHDLSRIAGGSSGGSAAAVAAGIVPVALGSDTAGSVRIPSSLCGVYGLKPSYGSIPSSGLYPLAPSLDHIGIIASNTEWIEKVFKIIARPDILRKKVREIDPDKAVLGIPIGLFKASEEVEKEFYRFLSGFKYKEVRLELAVRNLYSVFPAIRYSEATRTFLGIRDRWGELHQDVRRLLERGLEYKATEYIEALHMKEAITREFDKAMKDVDFLVTPTTPIPAPKIEEVLGREDGEIRTILTSNVIYPSLVGAPAISIPLLKTGGMPVGIQIIGKRYHDLELIMFASKLSKPQT